MPRPREYDDSLRIRLIERGAHLLATEGPAGVTTRRVASEEGTSTTAIYSLIGSKDDLMKAICLEGFTRLARHLGAVPRTDDALADIRRLGHAYFDMGTESPALYRAMFGSPPGSLGTAGLSEDEAAFTLSTLEVLIDAVRRCIDAGLLDGDAEDLALQFWSVGHGIVSLANTGMLGTVDEARSLYDRTIAALGRGLTTTTVPPDAPAA